MVVLSFDILCNAECDILDDIQFERLLRVCASGIVAYCATSPPCKEYSRLKLRPGGPQALRTPSQLDGRPGLTADESMTLQTSHLMLSRCVLCSYLTYDSGGHSHLEQPSSAMSWQEPVVQSYIQHCNCFCTILAACGYGLDIEKTWLFCSTLEAISEMAYICEHPRNSHQSVAGVRTSSGAYLSKYTAEYPPQLASKFADHVLPLLSQGPRDLDLHSAEQLLPVKAMQAPPFVRQDGGGNVSSGDWSSPPAGSSDVFKTLRHNWMQLIMKNRMDVQLVASLQQQSNDPPFTSQQLAPFTQFLVEFLEAQGYPVSWDIPSDQPMHLHILYSLQKILGDPDVALFPYLLEGVPTGFDGPIQPSNCFPLSQPDESAESPLLSVHHCNWSSAEDHPDEVRALIDEEVKNGWVTPFHGSLSDAQEQWPLGVAVGKLGLVLAEGRNPRLVVDNTVCGVNARCVMPEKATLPTARDVMRAYPIRSSQARVQAFSLDIKSAHKRMAVLPSHRGLLGFTFSSQLFFYNVCPFGAVFSAHFWSRLGGFFLRLFHSLTWLAHVGFLYVDDLFMFQDETVLPLSAAMICILCQICAIPVSWKKCELGSSIQWIGWRWHISVGYVTLPMNKLDKLRAMVDRLRTSERTTKKAIEQFLGLAMWVTQLYPSMRTWLHPLYRDLHAIPATHFSIDPAYWNNALNCLNDSMQFTAVPKGSAIPLGGLLTQVRHQTVHSISDVRNCYIGDKRIWLRIRDPMSGKRKLSEHSSRTLRLFHDWLAHCPPAMSIWPKQYWPGICVADAFASGELAGIGGIIEFPTQGTKWFSLRLSLSDFRLLDIPVHNDLQKDITSLETLAQIALLWIVIRHQPGFRMSIRVPSLSDNTGAESVSNALFTTTIPLAYFLEKLSLLIASSSISFDVTHIPGKANDVADQLSRWDDSGDIPFQLNPSDRILLSLSELWMLERRPCLCPPNAWIPWSLPS